MSTANVAKYDLFVFRENLRVIIIIGGNPLAYFGTEVTTKRRHFMRKMFNKQGFKFLANILKYEQAR